jgi:hypothetical protein
MYCGKWSLRMHLQISFQGASAWGSERLADGLIAFLALIPLFRIYVLLQFKVLCTALAQLRRGSSVLKCKMRRTGHFCTRRKNEMQGCVSEHGSRLWEGKANRLTCSGSACLLEWTALIRPIASVEDSCSRISISVTDKRVHGIVLCFCFCVVCPTFCFNLIGEDGSAIDVLGSRSRISRGSRSTDFKVLCSVSGGQYYCSAWKYGPAAAGPGSLFSSL